MHYLASLQPHFPTIQQLVDRVGLQTSRTCIVTAAQEPEMTASAHALPCQSHLAAATVNIFKCRQRMSAPSQVPPW